jgi:hypothetical protein
MKILYFFLFLWVIFALLDPDPDPATQINADPCGSGSETLSKNLPLLSPCGAGLEVDKGGVIGPVGDGHNSPRFSS